MSDNAGETAPAHWDSRPIIDWLLREGRFLGDYHDLTRELGQRLHAAGPPLWRLRLSMRTLHPLVTAVTAVWERDKHGTERLESTHGLEGRSGYVGSPMAIVVETGAAFRKRLSKELTESDHRILYELKARGGTDYFALPLRSTDATSMLLIFTSDASGGFSDADIESFSEIASVLAPIVEVFRLKRESLAVAEAYLGPRTGQRVLSGQITRGHIETINAAILISDIRDWTGLNGRVDAETALALANRYFEVVAEAVESHGGEILKPLGDGVLAVFPTETDNPDVISADAPGVDVGSACKRSLAAARDAFNLARESEPPLALDFGVGMHFGEVLYGNIGSKTRIDFTVLGQAVNVAARIEGLCGKLKTPLLFSQDFADRLSEPSRFVGEELLKGQETTSRLYTTAGSQPFSG